MRLATSDTRKGNYDEYHVFPNYIVTFLNDQSTTRIRYRRNPGFALLGETFYEPALQLDRTYHVVLLLQAGRLEFFVDGIRRYELADPAAWPCEPGRPTSAGPTWPSTASSTHTSKSPTDAGTHGCGCCRGRGCP